MLQKLLNAEKNGELKLSKKDILQAELPAKLTQRYQLIHSWLGLFIFISTGIVCLLWIISVIDFGSAFCGLLLILLSFFLIFLLVEHFAIKPIHRKYNQYEFDLLCANYSSYMSGIEYTADAKLMFQRIDNIISMIAGDHLRVYFDNYQKTEKSTAHLVVADVLLRKIDEKCRRKAHRFIEKHPALNTFGLPFFYLCLGAFIAMLLDIDNIMVKALTQFFIIAGLGVFLSWSFGYDSWQNKKKRQEVESYENLRKALNAIIES